MPLRFEDIRFGRVYLWGTHQVRVLRFTRIRVTDGTFRRGERAIVISTDLVEMASPARQLIFVRPAELCTPKKTISLED